MYSIRNNSEFKKKERKITCTIQLKSKFRFTFSIHFLSFYVFFEKINWAIFAPFKHKSEWKLHSCLEFVIESIVFCVYFLKVSIQIHSLTAVNMMKNVLNSKVFDCISRIDEIHNGNTMVYWWYRTQCCCCFYRLKWIRKSAIASE